MKNYDRIIKDCFWDLAISEEDIKNILHSNDKKKKAFLFDKILLNSTQMLVDLQIFTIDEIKEFLNEYKVQKFNYNHIFRRKNIAEVYFLNKPLEINELKWIA